MKILLLRARDLRTILGTEEVHCFRGTGTIVFGTSSLFIFLIGIIEISNRVRGWIRFSVDSEEYF